MQEAQECIGPTAQLSITTSLPLLSNDPELPTGWHNGDGLFSFRFCLVSLGRGAHVYSLGCLSLKRHFFQKFVSRRGELW